MADVSLQVVGLFYNVKLTVPDTGQTVQDLMDAARATPNPAGSVNGAAAFNYSTHVDSPGAVPTMSAMSVKYDAPFTSRVLTNKYPAGVYSLKESFDPNSYSNVYTVWQYYLFAPDGTYVSPSSVAEPFVNQSLDGIGRVTWRLVTILSGPSSVSPPTSKRAPIARMLPAT